MDKDMLKLFVEGLAAQASSDLQVMALEDEELFYTLGVLAAVYEAVVSLKRLAERIDTHGRL